MTLLSLSLVITVLVFITFSPSLIYWFSQDDFIHLSASRAGNINELINFFNPFSSFPDIFFYRPLTTQFYFFINHSLFGLNTIPFHLEALAIHILNAILFYLIILEVWKDKKIAALSAILYSVSAVHFLSIYFISSFQEIGRATFMFLSILLFIRKHYIYSVITYLAALLSKETSIILPIIILGVEILRNSEDMVSTIKVTLKQLLPYFILVGLYLVLRFFQIQKIFTEGGYQTDFSYLSIMQNLKWYLLWSFGLPEIISTYPSINISGVIQFMKDFSLSSTIVISFTILIISIFVFSTIFKKHFSKKTIISSLIIFFGSLIPVLPLGNHHYPSYLNITLLTFLPILAMLYIKLIKISKILVIISLTSFIILQLSSIELSRQTHWTTHRSKIAKQYFQIIKNTHPDLPGSSTIVFQGSEQEAKELSITLAKHYGLNIWYPGKTLTVKYQTVNEIISLPGPIIIPITTY